MTVYKITNQLNGKVYIGQTRQELHGYFKQQFNRAKCMTHRKPFLYAALNKYGKNAFTVEALHYPDTQEIMDAVEQYYIYYFRSQQKEYGYNISSGGQGAPGHVPWNKGKKNPYSEEILQKMSNSQKERFAREPQTGKIISEETKIKISETLKRKGIQPSHEAQLKGAEISTQLRIEKCKKRKKLEALQ